MQQIDHQTLKELEIISSTEGKLCLLDKLDFTRTRRGRQKLKEKFSHYSTSIAEIRAIQESLQYLLNDEQKWEFALHEEEISYLENYFYSNIAPIFSATKLDTLVQIARYQILYRGEYAYIRGGTFRLLHFLQGVQKRTDQLKSTDLPALLRSWIDKVQAVLEQKDIGKALAKFAEDKLDFLALIEYDYLFRIQLKDHIKELLELLAEMDALFSMAKSVRQYDLVFPRFVESATPVIELENVYHLFLNSPIGNTLCFNGQKNFLFLTGPNTAGKTTLLKACGMAVYLAHIGMGIPAKSATMSIFSDIFSSINPTDNLTAGYSYFYSEVMRVKEAVDKLKDNTSVFFMFDELFRGTNVKDAYDCSKLVIDGLQKWKSSIFIISSHITELASDMKQYPNVSFSYMESAVENSKPVFSYKLAKGVSRERLGLLILENERIFDDTGKHIT
jgi:DNA mismatch repair ATPase MutS